MKSQTPLFVAAALAVVIVVGAWSLSPISNGATYTVNGLTCPIPADYASFKAAVHLVPIVTQQPQFLDLANGSPYMFGNAENLTDRTQQVGNQPIQHLPDAVEMVFYTYGPSTFCDEAGGFSNPWLSTIVVQVPVQAGGFNLTGATYNAGGGPA